MGEGTEVERPDLDSWEGGGRGGEEFEEGGGGFDFEGVVAGLGVGEAFFLLEAEGVSEGFEFAAEENVHEGHDFGGVVDEPGVQALARGGVEVEVQGVEVEGGNAEAAGSGEGGGRGE